VSDDPVTAVDVVSVVLLLVGALSCLLGAIGLVRLPSLLSRLQAATKPQTFGLFLVLIGTALRVPLESAVSLVLVALFQVITAPVISQLVGRSAYRSGAVRQELLVVDEMADPTPRDAPAAGGGGGPGRPEPDGR
jgi:multicomponent Na+:H+ antiporter subunit G